MSRLTARKRWLMAGPWPHPKTGILYYRKATPADLWAERDRLLALGVTVKREVHRSLFTKDQRPAEQRYITAAAEQEAEWQRWRDLLREGPQPLSHRQRTALAADHARAFLARHEDEPFDAPPPPPIPRPDKQGVADWKALTAGMPEQEQAELKAHLVQYLRADGSRRHKLAFRLLERYPDLLGPLGSDLAAALETMHGADTDQALASQGLYTDAESRRVANLEMASFMGAAHRALLARQRGDYGPVRELEVAPTFEPSRVAAGVSVPSREDAYPSMIYLLHHRSSKKSIRPKTVRDNEGHLRKFIAFVGHDDAKRVTKDEVRRWRDSLIAQRDPSLSPKTIRDRYLSAVKAVLQHGVKEFDLPTNVAAGITDERESPALNRSKGWTKEEGLTILKATFQGVRKDISLPHRRAVFWATWIMAYTGLRAGEVTQMQGRDLRVVDGIPHLIVTPELGSTKSNRAWATGIHKHLIDLGLLEFIRAMGDGPLFYEPFDDGAELTDKQRASRVQSAYKRITDWVKDEVGLEPPLGRPNHAWRHLFTTRGRLADMNEKARNFMLGSSPIDARESYGDWPPEVLDREINKLPRFDVADTGWRP